MLRKIILLFFCIFILSVGIGVFWLHHEHLDYDVSKTLRTPQKSVHSASTASSLTRIGHVFVIVEENKDWQQIYKNPQAPFINSVLLPSGAYATNYHNVPTTLGTLHPSGPNYILLEAGSLSFPDHTFTSDNIPTADNSTSTSLHLSRLLENAGKSWKAYEEDISGNDCPIYITNKYAPKHNPFVYFQDVSGNPPSSKNSYCEKHIRPMSELKKDLAAGTLPDYVFITPNLQDDMHDGTIAEGDSWLSKIVPLITNSNVFKKDGALFITWDEGNESDTNNPIGMIVESPFVKPGYANTINYSHASFVKTVEEIFTLTPLLGFAGDPTTTDLSDFFK